MGSIRAGILLLATTLALMLGASQAYAAISLSVSKTEAASGEEVPFKITGTEAYSQYALKVENEVVARGSDPAGNGIDDKFKMPDLGSTEKTVTVEATVQQPSSPDPFVGSTTMQYVLFPTAPTGPTSDPQPQPVPLAPAPAAQFVPSDLDGNTTPTTTTPKKKTTGTKHRAKQSPSTNNNSKSHKETSTGSGGSSTPPTSTASPAPTTAPTGITRAPVPTHIKRSATAPTAQKPSGPVGAAGLQPPSGPSSGAGAPTSTPITGTATVTSGGGLSTALLVGLLLLALAAIAVGVSRLRYVDWHRFAFAGPEDPDELRLGALSRAARSGAETQEAIAVRKASRRAS